jgi:hypothetical protein
MSTQPGPQSSIGFEAQILLQMSGFCVGYDSGDLEVHGSAAATAAKTARMRAESFMVVEHETDGLGLMYVGLKRDGAAVFLYSRVRFLRNDAEKILCNVVIEACYARMAVTRYNLHSAGCSSCSVSMSYS